MASTLCQKLFEKLVFLLSNSLKFCKFRTTRFESNLTSKWSKFVSNDICRDFRLPVSAFETVARKSFNGLNFPIGHFMLPLLTLILKFYSLSVHHLISIWTTCWWNLNKREWYEIFKILSFFGKCQFGRRFHSINICSMLKY